MKTKFIGIFISLFVLLALVACGGGGSQDSGGGDSTNDSNGESASGDEVIEWDFSIWGGPREWTTPVEDWAEDMYELTDGRWKINIHYGEALAAADDNLEGLSNGLFEAAGVAPFYTPGVLPLQQVLDLPFISPIEPEEISLFLKASWEHPAIIEELENHNVVPLLHSIPSQYEYMGNKPIEKAEDFDGVRIAGMSAEQGRVFEKFGAVPNPMPAPEIYNAQERGALDGSIFPHSYAQVSYSLHEVSDYTVVNIAAGSPVSTYYANKDAWEALPDDIKEIHNEYIEDWHIVQAEPYVEADEKNTPMLQDIHEYSELPDEERQKLVDAAQEVWDEWADEFADRGPTYELIDYMLEKRMEISGF